MYKNMQIMRSNPETSRAGLPWTSEEDEQLSKEINDNTNINDIVKQHCRTYSAIRSRIIQYGISLINEGLLTVAFK
jgi:hypothetical protein